jgi:hypothetical protein
MATTTQPAIQKEPSLTYHEQWDTWIFSLRSKVDRYNLWLYLDPDTAAADVLKLVQPTRPTYDTVKLRVTKLAGLSTDERLELSELRAIYLEDQRLYGCADAYSRKIIWFFVGSSNRTQVSVLR